MPIEDGLLTPEEVADALSVEPSTVKRWLREGTISGIRISYKVWRVRRSVLEDFLRSRETAAAGSAS